MEGEASDETYTNLPAAINTSIYLMLAVPYASVGIVGFLIYRGVKKNQEYWRRQEEAGQQSEETDT